MDFNQAIKALNKLFSKQQPAKISSLWISKNAPHVYRFVWKNVRNEIGDIDWDKVTSNLKRKYQKRWTHRHLRTKRQWESLPFYEDQNEVDAIIEKYKDKMYTFLAPADYDDKIVRDAISIAFVRIAQKGNTIAIKEIIALLRYTVDLWIEYCYKLRSWKGYESELEEQIEACIRRYRFTGSFIVYLFKTLEYRGRGLRFVYSYSLDEQMLLGEKRRIENVVKDPETGKISYFNL
ncbi:MAG: hypothetical protein NTZ97_01930 [Candidatus Moranbacteria bacterium]|nr:hypothetical protein [Candidatus Moranbacteria bacterium]